MEGFCAWRRRQNIYPFTHDFFFANLALSPEASVTSRFDGRISLINQSVRFSPILNIFPNGVISGVKKNPIHENNTINTKFSDLNISLLAMSSLRAHYAEEWTHVTAL